MGQHSRLTMVGFFMELTYHELSDRTWDENPRARGGGGGGQAAGGGGIGNNRHKT